MSEGLPKGWTKVPFSALLTDLRNGISTRPNLEPPGTPILRISAVRPGSVLLDDHRFLRSGEDLATTFALRDRDLLFTRYNGSLKLLGVCGMVRGKEPAVVLYPDKLMRARVDERITSPAYIELFFQSPEARDAIMAIAKSSAGQQGISGANLKEQGVALAPLAEQDRIVEKVHALIAFVTAARDRLAKVPAILKRFRQSVLTAACSGDLTAEWRTANPGHTATPGASTLAAPSNRRVGDQIELADPVCWDTPSTWSWKPIRALLRPDRPAAYGVLQPGSDIPDGVPFVRVCDIESGSVSTHGIKRIRVSVHEQYPRTRLQGGEVLVTVVGTIGRTAVVPDSLRGANIARAVAMLAVGPECIPAYLRCVLEHRSKSRELDSLAREVARKTLNLGLLKAVLVPVPPPGEQLEIVRRVNVLLGLADSIERRVVAASARAGSLTQAILAKAFRGELVPTEAEQARAEGRGYESADALIARIRAERVVSSSVPKRRPHAARRGARL